MLFLDVYRDLSESIENEIYILFNSDSNKSYRDKINAIKMKLKVIYLKNQLANPIFFVLAYLVFI